MEIVITFLFVALCINLIALFFVEYMMRRNKEVFRIRMSILDMAFDYDLGLIEKGVAAPNYFYLFLNTVTYNRMLNTIWKPVDRYLEDLERFIDKSANSGNINKDIKNKG